MKTAAGSNRGGRRCKLIQVDTVGRVPHLQSVDTLAARYMIKVGALREVKR